MSAKELDNPQIAERIFEQTNETKRISIKRSSNFLKTNYIFAIIINNQIVNYIHRAKTVDRKLAIERLMLQPPIVSDPKYKRRSWSGSGVHGTWERLKRRNTSEDTSVTWPLESIKIRVSISMTRRIPPRISPRLYPLPKPDMRTVIRANGAAEYRHNRSRGYTQKYIPCLSLSLSMPSVVIGCFLITTHWSGVRSSTMVTRFHDRGTPDDRTLSIIAVPSSAFLLLSAQLAPPPFPPFLSAGDFARLPSRISFPPPTFLFRFSRLANPGRELTF